jgi:C-terminal processing protease CtpA/Prc
MSTDEAKVQDALSYLVMDDFDDGHSNTLGPSYLLGSDYDIHADKFNGVSNTAYNKRMAIFSAARTSALGTYKPYEVVDDTAYVTFDEFKSQQSDYYASFPSEAQASQDTMALVGYSHKQILANSAIKNVVVDLSCNGGGEINACAYIASWLTGDTTITEQNPNNHCFASTIYRADTNYDNTYDADDTLQGRGLHLYCLTSLCSFSCGNLLPNLCKNAHNVSLIGQHTGGGACAVQTTSMADGTYFRISGCSRLCNSLNGTLYNVDAGVEPDYYLQNAASYYNRDQLSKYLDTLL